MQPKFDDIHVRFVDAVLAGNVSAVKSCLTRVHDINALVQHQRMSTYFRSPLVAAVAECCNANTALTTQIVRLLVEAGAKPELLDSEKLCALHRVVHPEHAKILFSACQDPTLCMRTYTGETLLHCHATFERIEICELLIKRKADVNALNYNGNTALMVSVELGWPKALPMLLSNGADLGIQNRSGHTALSLEPINGCGAPSFVMGRQILQQHVLLVAAVLIELVKKDPASLVLGYFCG